MTTPPPPPLPSSSTSTVARTSRAGAREQAWSSACLRAWGSGCGSGRLSAAARRLYPTHCVVAVAYQPHVTTTAAFMLAPWIETLLFSG